MRKRKSDAGRPPRPPTARRPDAAATGPAAAPGNPDSARTDAFTGAIRATFDRPSRPSTGAPTTRESAAPLPADATLRQPFDAMLSTPAEEQKTPAEAKAQADRPIRGEALRPEAAARFDLTPSRGAERTEPAASRGASQSPAVGLRQSTGPVDVRGLSRPADLNVLLAAASPSDVARPRDEAEPGGAGWPPLDMTPPPELFTPSARPDRPAAGRGAGLGSSGSPSVSITPTEWPGLSGVSRPVGMGSDWDPGAIPTTPAGMVGLGDPGPFGDRGGYGPSAVSGERGEPIDLSKTNELLQQLLDEVRRGRQTFLPVNDRGPRI